MSNKLLLAAASLLQVTLFGLGSWNLAQSVDNGREIASLKKELQIRVETAEKQHAEFVLRREIDPKISFLADQIKSLADSNLTLAAAIREEREFRIRREGQAAKNP